MSDAFDDCIVKVEKIVLKTPRPREIGFNSRKGAHGDTVVDPVVRIHTANGYIGVGWSNIDRSGAEVLLGRPVGELFRLPNGSLESDQQVDLPL